MTRSTLAAPAAPSSPGPRTPAFARASSPGASTTSTASFGDTVLLFAGGLNALTAIGAAFHYGRVPLALAISVLLLGIAAVARAIARGSLVSRLVLTACNAALVALAIDIGRGTIEFHFGVFVLLALLLIYRDWRPIVFAAAIFAVHHVLFDRLQAAGFPVYCTPEPNLLKIVMHAGYVVVQTAAEVWIALRLQQLDREGSELHQIVARLDGGERVRLDLDALAIRSPSAVALKRMIGRIGAAVGEVDQVAAGIRHASDELAAGNLDLSRRTEAQAANLQETAASMSQLTATVGHNADTAQQASQLASTATAAAMQGGKVVGEVVVTMQQIADASKQIPRSPG